MGIRFTSVQVRMLDVLKDGKPHTKEELFACLEDDMATMKAIRKHISLIRTQLRTIGEDVVCEFHARRFKYRHVRILTLSDNGELDLARFRRPDPR